jgi:hypothetical protein
MKRTWLIVSALALSLVVSGAVAQDWQGSGDDAWVEGWLGLEIIENNGGFAASALVDFISEGTGGSHTHETVSTQSGVRATQSMVVALADYGGDHTWKPITIDTEDGDNMATSWGLDAGSDDIEWYGIIIAASPSAQTVTMHPAHDDHLQIWLNGAQVYDNSAWTGGVRTVTTPTDIDMNKGGNVMLFKCGESGGSAYVNVFFAADNLEISPTVDGQFFEVLDLVGVEAKGKSSVTWGGLKAAR